MAFLYGEKVVRRMILAGDFSFEESLRSTMAVLAGAVVCDLKKCWLMIKDILKLG